MPNRIGTILAMAAAMFAVSDCSSLTEPQLLTDFEWGEVDDPSAIEERIQTQVVFGDLIILGQMQTPTRCYTLEPDFSSDGSRLTLRVRAKAGNAPTCNQSLGGYRYTMTVHNLEFGTYELRVIHDISGGQGGQFTETVNIR